MKIGFIGSGNMATAIMKGIIANELVTPKEVIASDKFQGSVDKVVEDLGVVGTTDNKVVIDQADIVVLAVKPQYYQEVLKEMRKDFSNEKILVSIAPGKSISWLEEQIGTDKKIVRTMPNTPALVGEGMTGICFNQRIQEAEKNYALSMFNAVGKCQEVEEYLMDAVVSVSGSSPAYVFMFIEAMADAAVADGMPRGKAYEFAAQAVLGSAKMVLETGKHPGELKDMVCSPGGTTITAVRVLEEKGLRGTVMDAMKVCTEKAKGM